MLWLTFFLPRGKIDSMIRIIKEEAAIIINGSELIISALFINVS
jgi:hypothetical protein